MNVHPQHGAPVTGAFVEDAGETWYRIDGVEQLPPFFVALASDSDVWAFVSTAGSLAAGRREAAGSFFPYETVDRIHQRWEHVGPRTWVRLHDDSGRVELWQPFAQRLEGGTGLRSAWKNLSGTKLRLSERHPSGRLVFQHEWSSAAELGLVRSVSLTAPQGPVHVQLLDGLLGLVPPGVSVVHATTMSCLADAYTWNEAAAGGRLGLFTLAAQIWDRAEPKESFDALAAWHAGLPADTSGALRAAPMTLLSARQVGAFCRGETIQHEALTRGQRAAFLLHLDADIDAAGLRWHQVLDGPHSQVQAFELARRLEQGGGTAQEIDAALARNTAGLDELLARADGFQHSADAMAAAHHRANVLFNIMRGGVFADGTLLDRDDLLAFLQQRHRNLAAALTPALSALPPRIERAQAIEAARLAAGEQGERLLLGYLPLTFSRRHGDPSRPWNRFSIRVRDAAGRRVINHEGNWRDIFQNWEALASSEPAYLDSMISTFLGAMTADGYNPYRIARSGIDWEVIEPENAWSQYGYWGDHQVVYLLRLLEAAHAREPALLEGLWDRAVFSFADVPYRLLPFAAQTAHPKHTLAFDEAAHQRSHERAARLGSDALLICDDADQPVLATLAEKLAVIVLAKAGSLVPGGGLWLHTQRPEWNDANNALVGNGLSVVTLAHLRRFLVFIAALPGATRPFTLPLATLQALQGLNALAHATPTSACHDERARRDYLDRAGALLDAWRAEAYRGAAGRTLTSAPANLLPALTEALLPLIDATLAANRRASDKLFHSYNLVDLSQNGRAAVSALYPMLEGQVALLQSGWLGPAEAVALLDALFSSPLYDAARRSFLLYPDRALPGFLDRNRLDDAALALPVAQAILERGRSDLLQRQSDGTVRFAPQLANRADLEAAAAAGSGLGMEITPLAEAYDRLLGHHAFTGRSGTMFAYEGLGCIYWHMVAKLLLAVQECAFDAADHGAHAECDALKAHYRRVRDGLGYRKTPAEWGAFPTDPYSHTPGEGGAQQPGMTGQVKEEILARWGELGLRIKAGRVQFDPLLLDEAEIPAGGALEFTWAHVPCAIRRGAQTTVRVRTSSGWLDCADRSFAAAGVLAVEIELRV